MQCWQCGRSVRQGAKLCIYCGAKLAEDDEQEPRRSESRSGRRSSEQGRHRSPAPRGTDDTRGKAPPYGDSEEYAAYKPPDARDNRYVRDERYARDDHHARRERPPSHPRDGGGHPDRSADNSRSRDRSTDDSRSRDRSSRDPMDDPRAPIQRSSRATPPSSRERREPNRDNDMRSASRPARDDEWGGGGEPRPPRGSRREEPGDYTDYDHSQDYDNSLGKEYNRATPPSSSDSRRRSDMERGYDARGGRSNGYDERSERGSSRDRHPSRGPQLERDRERGGYRGDARGAPYPQPLVDDSWGMPAVGAAPVDDWGVAPSEELPTPMGARAGRDALGRSGSARRGKSSDKGDKAKGSIGGRIFRAVSLMITILGLISSGVLVAPKILSHFGFTQGGTGDTQPPFATYTPGPTPTPPPNYVEYVSKHLQFAIDYPKGWSTGESSADAGKTDWVDTFRQPSPQAEILVERSTGFDTIGNDEMIHAEVLAGQSDGSTFTETTTAPVHALIGGEQWLRRDFDVTAKAGAKVHMGILSCHHQGHGYVIVLTSLPQNFAHDDQTTFQTTLGTFRFLP